MFEETTKTLMDAVKTGLETVMSTQGKATFGVSAVDAAKAKPHANYRDGGGFEKGDIITFPENEEELTEYIGKQGTSIFCVLPITRSGKTIAVPVYSKWLHNDVHPCDDNGKIDEENWHSHKGQPADDARCAGMSDYDVFKVMLGRKVKVTDVRKLQCRVLKRGAERGADGHFAESDFIAGKRKFYTLEYVTA